MLSFLLMKRFRERPWSMNRGRSREPEAPEPQAPEIASRRSISDDPFHTRRRPMRRHTSLRRAGSRQRLRPPAEVIADGARPQPAERPRVETPTIGTTQETTDWELARALQEEEDMGLARELNFSGGYYGDPNRPQFRSLQRLFRPGMSLAVPEEVIRAREQDATDSGETGEQERERLNRELERLRSNATRSSLPTFDQQTAQLLMSEYFFDGFGSSTAAGSQSQYSTGSEVPPATPEEISALPVHCHQQMVARGNGRSGGNGNQSNNDGPDRNCSICLMDFVSGEPIRSMPCLHQFHAKCVDRWLITKKSCPVCKLVICTNG